MPPKFKRECRDSHERGGEPGTSRGYAPSDPQKLCAVCGACASGRHFGAYTCESCKLFFLRLTQGKNARPLKCAKDERCNIQSRLRSVCRLCRYKKCIASGMSKDRIVYGRNARNSQKYSSPRKQRIHSEPIVDAGSSEYATQGTGGNNGFPQSFSNPGSACQPEPYFLGPPICSATCTTTTSAYSPTSCLVAGSSTRTVVSTDSSQENVVNTSMVHDNTTTTTSNSASCYTVMPGIEGELYLELPDPECFPASQDHNNSPPSSNTRYHQQLQQQQQSVSQSTENGNWVKRERSPSESSDEDEEEEDEEEDQNPEIKKEFDEPSELKCKDDNKRRGVVVNNCAASVSPLQYCHLTTAETERFTNYYNIFIILGKNWLPKIESAITHSDLSICLRETKSFAAQFIKYDLLPNSIAFQNLTSSSNNNNNSYCFNNNLLFADVGKVIFPFVHVLLVLPFMDVLFKRVEQNDTFDIRSVGVEFLHAVKCLKKLQMTQCEYATLVHYFSLQPYANALKQSRADLPLHKVFLQTESERKAKTWGPTRARTISSELCYMNNIMISVFGAYSHLEYLNVFHDLLSSLPKSRINVLK